jgi:hypothetical protein
VCVCMFERMGGREGGRKRSGSHCSYILERKENVFDKLTTRMRIKVITIGRD